jgi:hypothetical protein
LYVNVKLYTITSAVFLEFELSKSCRRRNDPESLRLAFDGHLTSSSSLSPATGFQAVPSPPAEIPRAENNIGKDK